MLIQSFACIKPSVIYLTKQGVGVVIHPLAIEERARHREGTMRRRIHVSSVMRIFVQITVHEVFWRIIVSNLKSLPVEEQILSKLVFQRRIE